MLTMTRFFTRAGRDPLTLAPFEMKDVGGTVLRMPTAWSPASCALLAESARGVDSSSWLVALAREAAGRLRSTPWQASEDVILELGDEFSWIMARSMGWLCEEAGYTVGVVNLAPFCEPVTGRFDLAGLKQVVKVVTILAAARAHSEGRPGSFAAGWTNLGGLLLAAGISYESSRALGISGSIAAMILGEASYQASLLASLAPLPAYHDNAMVVEGGLANARARAAELPPTRQDSTSAAEPDRWKGEAVQALDLAIEGARQRGILTRTPVFPMPCKEAEKWLDPISTLAEAVPTLEIPELGHRLEMKSAMRAIGLSEPQKQSLISALAKGADLSQVELAPEKVAALKTALGSWSFHPNVQVSMASAVAPFVAGPLAHRVHLPSGVPHSFVSPLAEYASRLGLTGLSFVEDEKLPQAPEELPSAEPTAEDDEKQAEMISAEVQEAIELNPADSAPTEQSSRPHPQALALAPFPALSTFIPTADELRLIPPLVERAELPSEVQVESEPSQAEVSEALDVEDRIAVSMPEPSTASPDQVEESHEESDPDLAGGPISEKIEAPEEPEPTWEVPAGAKLLVQESKTIRVASDLFVHLISRSGGSTPEVVFSLKGRTGEERDLMDSLAAAVTLGLERGVPLDALAEAVQAPPYAKAALQAIREALPGSRTMSAEEDRWYIPQRRDVRIENPGWSSGGRTDSHRAPGE